MDYPYVILLLILLVLAFLEWKRPELSNKYFKIGCWVVFCFVALRAPVVGADTWDYYRYATNVRKFYNYDSRELEILYEWYNSFFRKFVPVGLVFMISNTILIFAPIRYILNKYVERKTFAVLVFFLISDYYPFFVALRQMLSLSFILWGVIYVQGNHKYKWLIFAGLSTCAYFMHTTAVVVALLYFAAYFIPLKNRWIPIGLVALSAVFGVILEQFNILSAFDFFLSLNFQAIDRVSAYFENEKLNELGAINITLRTSVVAIIAFYFISHDKLNHWFSKIYLIGVILFNLFISVPMIGRMIIANTMFVIVVLPWVFENKLHDYLQKRLKVIMLLLVLYFTRSFIINNIEYDIFSEGKMHPYYFFFQDYHDHPSIKYLNM